MRIGILGGTFDPIHRGHGYVARTVLDRFDLDRVLFMVSKLPPHKPKGGISSSFHRYAMTVLDLLDQDRLYPSDWELTRSHLSYTIQTLEHYASSRPRDQFCFIAGSDSLQEIHLWKEYARLLRQYCFVFVQRPGYRVCVDELEIEVSLRKTIREVCDTETPPLRPGCSFLIAIDAPAISSSAVRRLIASGHPPPSDMISAPVLRYIQKHRLYEKNQDRC